MDAGNKNLRENVMKLNNKYYILRHGEAKSNAKGIVSCLPEKFKNPLTRKGASQIKSAVDKLINKNINLIFASPLLRTTQTAEIVGKALKIKIKSDKRLREINLGIFEGKSREKFFDIFPKFSEALFYNKPRCGESWTDCRKRLENLLKEIDKKYKNKNILIISHGDPLWLLEGLVKGINNKDLIAKKKKLFLKTGKFKKLSR